MSSNSSSLTGSALQASRAALSAALVEHDQSNQIPSEEELIEAGEIQEIDMQGQADAIRTVFSDPSNFNVKVGYELLGGGYLGNISWCVYTASSLFCLDTLVRLPLNQRP